MTPPNPHEKPSMAYARVAFVSSGRLGEVDDVFDLPVTSLIDPLNTPTAPPKMPWTSRTQMASGSCGGQPSTMQSVPRQTHTLGRAEGGQSHCASLMWVRSSYAPFGSPGLTARLATMTARLPCRSAILLHRSEVKNCVMKKTETRLPVHRPTVASRALPSSHPARAKKP